MNMEMWLRKIVICWLVGVIVVSANDSCSSVKQMLDNLRTLKRASGEPLSALCSNPKPCCTSEDERYLLSRSRDIYNVTVVSKLEQLIEIFDTGMVKFDEIFVALLDSSKLELHEMLLKSYGFLYEHNSHIFNTLFRDLRSFFKTGAVDLSDTMDRFFEALFQRVFVLFNTQYAFDEVYEDCVADNMKQIRPFDNIPEQLTSQIKKSFVAARTFTKALLAGRDVLMGVSEQLNASSSSYCLPAITRQIFCPYCQGITSIKPCLSSCISTVHDFCLPNHGGFIEDWDAFINELLNLAEKVEGPLNIENVIEPIELKLSDAIAGFQENLALINDKVYQACGQPSLSRKKRNVASDTLSTTMRPPSKRPRSTVSSVVRVTTDSSLTIEGLVHEIRLTLNDAQGFWLKLPRNVCIEWNSTDESQAACWNGIELSNDRMSNATVSVRPPSSSADDKHRMQLTAITNKMRKARLDASRPANSDADDDDGSGNFGEDDEPSGSGEDDVPFFSHTSIPSTPIIRSHADSALFASLVFNYVLPFGCFIFS